MEILQTNLMLTVLRKLYFLSAEKSNQPHKTMFGIPIVVKNPEAWDSVSFLELSHLTASMTAIDISIAVDIAAVY